MDYDEACFMVSYIAPLDWSGLQHPKAVGVYRTSIPMHKTMNSGLDKSGARTPRTTRKRFWATTVRAPVARWTSNISHFLFLKYIQIYIQNCIFNSFKAVASHTDLHTD